MKKIVFITVLMAALLFSAAGVFAYPFCGPHQPPNQYSAFCRYDLTANDTYRVRSDVPFVWLRSDPTSTAPVVHTVYPSADATLVTAGAAGYWDGYQWWWEMTTYPGREQRGWVERISLAQVVITTPPDESVTDASIQLQAKWETPFGAIMEQSENVSFVWIREQPAVGRILYSIRPTEPFQVIGSPESDGYQWWWPVRIGSAAATITGWVEQGSIVPLS